MIVLRVGHALPHNVAISDSFSDESVPGAMNVRYLSAVKWLNDEAVSTRSSCAEGVSDQGARTVGGTCMGRVSDEDDGVEGFEAGEARRDLGDERCGGADVERHDGEPSERARREQQGVEGQGGVAGVERHRDALDRATADKVGGDVWRGEDGAKVFEAGQGLGREREGVHGVEAPETDLDEVGLRLEEAGEEGLAAHRGGEYPEREGASLEDPREIGGVVVGGELEAEVGEVGEALEGALEEAEKVCGEEVVGPLEVESTDELRIQVVPREGLDEAQGPLGGNVYQRTIQHTRGDLVHDRTRGEQRDEVAPRDVSENELECLWRQHRNGCDDQRPDFPFRAQRVSLCVSY